MPVERVRGNVLEDMFWKLKRYRTTQTTVEIRNCAGEYRLVVPEGTSFVEKYESTGEYEPVFERELKDRLSSLDDPTYYDIGSRWGYFTKFSCLVTSPGSTHGFDANPHWFALLQQTHESDLPDITLTNAYVASESDDDTICIDDYRLGHDAPDIVKIDIEGSEYEALEGMRATLDDVHPELFVEIHPTYLRDRGTSAAAVFELLREVGYELRVATDHRTKSDVWSPLSDVELPSDGDYLVLAE
ncbi:FkbM family methyltransferase [Haladaptatus sp. DYF46]|uniref:FkbM family methyltransferase n=1 Tax=Haladaptatus sp. DYF46 TaxID=2886041 RepID=UPI001E49FE35|nr:FkbM family methyltransferase [Haladaptatus sp. DYF46]